MSEHRFRLIGDPHLTRKFEFGVPLSRRGEREELLFTDFKDRLNAGTEPMIVVVGDLLEKPVCSIQDIHRIMNIITDACYSQPERLVVILAGNHDVSPQSSVASAFYILKHLDSVVENLRVLTEPEVIQGVAMFPWQWDRTALEQLEDVKGQKFDLAIGHWDLSVFDPDHTEHLCPAKQLQELGAERIYTGHWHIAGDYVVDGVTVHCTGSMQPMNHAEDPDGKMYVTLTLKEYEDADPDSFKNKYVRVLAKDDEDVSLLEDCLGFKVQRQATAKFEDQDVNIEGFKVSKVIEEKLKEHEVPETVGSFIKERIDATD